MTYPKNFEELYKQFQPSLLNFAIYLTGSRPDALEIVNDVFLNVWDKRENLDLDDSLKGYLFSSVKNRTINFHKKKRLKVVQDLPNDRVSDFSADRGLLEKEQSQIMLDILESLPPKCRQVFVMSRIDCLSYKEIAELMDISVKTVEGQMSKALKVFRKKLLLK